MFSLDYSINIGPYSGEVPPPVLSGCKASNNVQSLGIGSREC